MFKRLFIFFICLLVAQITWAKGSLVSDFTSPVTTNAKYILLVGSAATAIIMLDQHHDLDGQAEAKTEFDPPLKKYGYIGEVIGWGYLNGLYILGFGFDGLTSNNKKSKQRATIMLSSSFNTLLITSAIKFSAKRTRPGFQDKQDSFPSGHASMGYNFAAVVTAEHGMVWGLLAHTVATAISYTRVNDRWHWVSDITAGATIGMSYGWGVYLNRRTDNPDYWLSFYPLEDPGSFGVSLTHRF